jgi:hypothetical protein
MSTATYAMRRNQNLYRTGTEVRLGPVSVGFVIIATIAVLALIYLHQITKTSVFGYKVTELQRQRSQAVAAKQELEVEAARLSSIKQIQTSPVVKSMVPEDKVSYAR